MDLFITNLPDHSTTKQVAAFFAPALAHCGITISHCEKFRSKNLANITVLDTHAAQNFLALYGVARDAPRHASAAIRLVWHGKTIRCCESRYAPSQFSLRALWKTSEDARKAAQSASLQTFKPSGNTTRFAIGSVHCGNWDYADNCLAFLSQFAVQRQGTVSFGRKEGLIVLSPTQDDTERRICIDYANCSNVVIGPHDDPSVTFTLRYTPKIYESVGENSIAAALLALTLDSSGSHKKEGVTKYRTSGINEDHQSIVGVCFTYRITLSNPRAISSVRDLLNRYSRVPGPISLETAVINPAQRITQSFAQLIHNLTDQSHFGHRPFKLRFQLEALARNGILLPNKVLDLLPKVSFIHQTYGLEATLSALRKFARAVPFAGPGVDAFALSRRALEDMLQDFADSYNKYRYDPENPYELTKRHAHINLIHKVIVTPCGLYFGGPEPEPANRVLRKYAHHIDDFVRVYFQDEDGSSVRYDSTADQDAIYGGRFKTTLDQGILVVGKQFGFLGFSHSSLRSQSCWFMAPFHIKETVMRPKNVIKELGDFTNIRIPAKCAARIGQNFTDTNATIDLSDDNVGELAMIQDGSYDFSDGVGTISYELLRKIWRVYGQRRQLKPTAIQIRYKGYKGMVALDSRLTGEQMMLRENMKKYEAGSSILNLEVCGAAFKPLPMVLNRQFIKIFEDRGFDPAVFMDLQNQAVNELQGTVTDALKTAKFLRTLECSRATRLPGLITHLDQIGLDYRQSPFLAKVVDIAAIIQLRDIKYRGRIPVKDGVTLYGIVDETGELREGEIFVVTEDPVQGGRKVTVQNNVVVTRSPALHPGDVQVVNAVNVRADSPLHRLSNVVVFSQHRERDLPSQLSGGDLDGDLYNVITDPRLVPSTSSEAAAYPKLSAIALDREVDHKDMSDFFVTFMQSDLLGLISNIHMQLADQRIAGTYDPDCIKLAGMASTAVNFSKTGILVNMKNCPKYDRCRPDFMAPSTRFVIANTGHLDLQEEDDGEDDAFEGLDAERRACRYYESDKVLGKLFRAIDERQFLQRVEADRSALVPASGADILICTLLEYVKREASKYGLLFTHHRTLAEDIRAGYEDSLIDILHYYEPSPRMPVSEYEAFAGTILGRQTGASGKPLRELSKTLRERLEAVTEYTVMRIVKGDEQMRGVNDLDLLYDESIDRETEALPRAIACLEAAVHKPGMVDRELGEVQSLKYVAAAVCLKELEWYMVTTAGVRKLPRV